MIDRKPPVRPKYIQKIYEGDILELFNSGRIEEETKKMENAVENYKASIEKLLSISLSESDRIRLRKLKIIHVSEYDLTFIIPSNVTDKNGITQYTRNVNRLYNLLNRANKLATITNYKVINNKDFSRMTDKEIKQFCRDADELTPQV